MVLSFQFGFFRAISLSFDEEAIILINKQALPRTVQILSDTDGSLIALMDCGRKIIGGSKDDSINIVSGANKTCKPYVYRLNPPIAAENEKQLIVGDPRLEYVKLIFNRGEIPKIKLEERASKRTEAGVKLHLVIYSTKCYRPTFIMKKIAYAMKGISLSNYIDNSYSNFTEQQKWKYFFQIVRELDILHKSGIVHRDLKPENIIVLNDGKIKLTDFGLCSIVIYDVNFAGMLAYIAPEIYGAYRDYLISKGYDDKQLKLFFGYSKFYIDKEPGKYKKANASNDMWALGMSYAELFYNIKHKEISRLNSCSAEYKDLVLHLLFESAPVFRPTSAFLYEVFLTANNNYNKKNIENCLVMQAIKNRNFNLLERIITNITLFEGIHYYNFENNFSNYTKEVEEVMKVVLSNIMNTTYVSTHNLCLNIKASQKLLGFNLYKTNNEEFTTFFYYFFNMALGLGLKKISFEFIKEYIDEQFIKLGNRKILSLRLNKLFNNISNMYHSEFRAACLNYAFMYFNEFYNIYCFKYNNINNLNSTKVCKLKIHNSLTGVMTQCQSVVNMPEKIVIRTIKKLNQLIKQNEVPVIYFEKLLCTLLLLNNIKNEFDTKQNIEKPKIL